VLKNNLKFINQLSLAAIVIIWCLYAGDTSLCKSSKAFQLYYEQNEQLDDGKVWVLHAAFQSVFVNDIAATQSNPVSIT